MSKSVTEDLRAEFHSLTPEQRECMAMIHGLTPEQQHELLTFARLVKNPGFRVAYNAATPPGERTPPYEVVHNLLEEWRNKA